MLKADLLTRAMDATNLQGPVARKAVEALFENLRGALQRGDRVVLRRFGVFRAAPARRASPGIRARASRWVFREDGWCASAPR